MKLIKYMAMGMVLIVLPALATATTLSLDSPTAVFSNAHGVGYHQSDSHIDYIDNGSSDATVRFGAPASNSDWHWEHEGQWHHKHWVWAPDQHAQSGLEFNMFDPVLSTGTNQSFALGQLTHFNNPVNSGTSIDSVDLDIGFMLDNTSVDLSYTFGLGVDETPNSTPCEFQSTTPCADKITFPDDYDQQSFSIDGTNYFLNILGFGDADGNLYNGNQEFITQEHQDNTATLWAMFTQEKPTPPTNDVPEPGSLFTLALGLIALSLVGIRRKMRKG